MEEDRAALTQSNKLLQKELDSVRATLE